MLGLPGTDLEHMQQTKVWFLVTEASVFDADALRS